MLQYITQVYLVHVEYRQKVNRCGHHTDRNGMKTPTAKYLVQVNERICQDLWWWSIQYAFIKDKHVFLHFLLSLSPSSPVRSRWLSVSVEDKSVFYQPETVQYLALLWAQECLRSHYSLLTVTYQFLLFYTLHYWFSITEKHCGGIESFYHLSEITAHALIRFHALRGLGLEYARPPPHICACTLSSIFMDHSHCHTLSHRSTS